MHSTDFNYDGLRLSQFNFIICHFDQTSGVRTATAGSDIVFEKSTSMSGIVNNLVNTRYSGCIKTSFDICKNPDTTKQSEMRITDSEYRELARWLNRREFLKFFVYDDIEIDKHNYYYKASFNLEKIYIKEKLYGIRLEMETDCPFAYGAEETITFNSMYSGRNYTIENKSDVIGYLYPNISIYIRSSGTLTLSNNRMNTPMIIKNCTSGETISIDGANQIITSSNSSHKLYNDFNYNFLQLINSYNDKNNNISTSLSIDLTLKYTPLIMNVM